MSLNYSFIDESVIDIKNSSKNSIKSIKESKKNTQSLASKLKNRLKRRTDEKKVQKPLADYEAFEDSDNEMFGHFDSNEANYEASKQNKVNTKNETNALVERVTGPHEQSEYTKQYRAPNYDAIMMSNSANADSNTDSSMLLSKIPSQNEKNSVDSVKTYYHSGSNDELMTKLNYLIHLLEDQKDEKVGSITEELVLYCFLGVFIIFVLDSFVKVGKYVR